VDLDGDGHIDLISGSWPGEVFFFRGGPRHTFAAPVKLKDKSDKTINIGGGRFASADEFLFIGDATFEKNASGKTVIRYEGEDIEIPEGKKGLIGGAATSVHAVDWNADGKIDLLIGEFEGPIYLVPNEAKGPGLAFGKAQALHADGKLIQVPGGHAGPFAADWDGDGKLDLIVGAGDGSVWFYRNLGDAKVPKLAAGRMLVEPGSDIGDETPKEPRRGVRAKVCVVDWNGDGRLDLLVGDFANQNPDHLQPTPAEQAEHDQLRKEFEIVQKRRSELEVRALGPQRERDPEKLKKILEEGKEITQKWIALRAKLHHRGWVWLFLRKPAESKGAK
jgi:VCBS repeat protein